MTLNENERRQLRREILILIGLLVLAALVYYWLG